MEKSWIYKGQPCKIAINDLNTNYLGGGQTRGKTTWVEINNKPFEPLCYQEVSSAISMDEMVKNVEDQINHTLAAGGRFL